jgi:hypothetical protein
LELLKTFWDELIQSEIIKNPPPIASDPKIGKQWQAQMLGGEILKRQFPSWSHLMWESQLPLLSKVLTKEQVREIHKFHWQLESISDLRDRLYQLNTEYFNSYGEGWRTGSSLDHRACEWVETFKTTTVDTLEKGNPLQVTPTPQPNPKA